MKINNFLIIYVKERDLLFYRIGCIIGIIIFPILIYTYEYMYIQPYPYISITIPLMILYLMFVLVTIINKLKKYAYLFAVLSIYETTLFLIFLMVMMGFQQNIVLATAITISTLASGFKTQKVMDTYLVSMILLSIIAILFYLGFSPEAFIAITPLLVWPTLIYYMLKSKYLDESNLKKI